MRLLVLGLVFLIAVMALPSYDGNEPRQKRETEPNAVTTTTTTAKPSRQRTVPVGNLPMKPRRTGLEQLWDWFKNKFSSEKEPVYSRAANGSIVVTNAQRQKRETDPNPASTTAKPKRQRTPPRNNLRVQTKTGVFGFESTGRDKREAHLDGLSINGNLPFRPMVTRDEGHVSK